jgi:hypothetical protein
MGEFNSNPDSLSIPIIIGPLDLPAHQAESDEPSPRGAARKSTGTVAHRAGVE